MMQPAQVTAEDGELQYRRMKKQPRASTVKISVSYHMSSDIGGLGRIYVFIE